MIYKTKIFLTSIPLRALFVAAFCWIFSIANAQGYQRMDPKKSHLQLTLYQTVEGKTSSATATFPISQLQFSSKNKVPLQQFLNEPFEIKIGLKTMEVSGVDPSEFEELKTRLQSEDYFFAKKFPFIHLNVLGIRNLGKTPDGSVQVDAEIKIREVKKRITFPTTLHIDGKYYHLKTDVLRLSRREFGSLYQSSRRNVVIQDYLDIQLELVRYQPAKLAVPKDED